jgi:hypothetical protein
MSDSKKQKLNAMTAGELMALKEDMLRTDSTYRAQVEAVETARRERSRILRKAEQPIVRDLKEAGFEVNSVWDLGNRSKSWLAALPVLLKHLQRGGYPDPVMESLGSLLAVKESVVYWDTLRDLYLAAEGRREEEGLARALSACATKKQLDDLITLLRDESRGSTRILFVKSILKLGGQRGRDLVESLRSDSLFGREANALLKKR